ncbi:pre-rRNA-processing protein pno1 [Rhodotorula kratochvilovae]
MSTDGFLPASAVNAKSKKLARQAASKPTVSSSTKKAKGKGKVSAAPSHLLSTQPAADADADDAMDGEFERLPLDAGVAPRGKVGSAAAGDADAAMATDAQDDDDADDAVMIDPSQLPVPVTRTPIAQLEAAAAAAAADPNALAFAPVKSHNQAGLTQRRKIAIPPHRMTPLKRDWIKIYTPLVEECGLQVRMNVHKRQVELKTSKHTPHPSSLTRAADFLAAYCTGFEYQDAIAMLRMEELYIESFEIKDVKMLHGDHLSRAIGRLAGHEGKSKHIIESASRTRIVLADTKISILGTYANIAVARGSISQLIMGSPPGKVYANLRTYASRQRSRF